MERVIAHEWAMWVMATLASARHMEWPGREAASYTTVVSGKHNADLEPKGSRQNWRLPFNRAQFLTG
jgi:hypothetical protein